MPTNNRKTNNDNAAQGPNDNGPVDLWAQALAAIAKQPESQTKTTKTTAEVLSQPLSDRDKAALARMGWASLTSDTIATPKEKGGKKPPQRNGPSINPETFADLTPERQASLKFWASLCATIARNKGRVWLPEAAAVAYLLEIGMPGPSALASRLATMVGHPVSRPQVGPDAGWLVCKGIKETPASPMLASLWNQQLQTAANVLRADTSPEPAKVEA